MCYPINMFKKIVTFFVVILGLIVLVYGYFHYQSKLKSVSENNITKSTIKGSVLNSQSVSSSSSIATSNISKLDKNLPTTVQEGLKKAVAENKPFVLTLFVKLDSTLTDTLKNSILSAYGNGSWTVNVINYNQETSADLVNSSLLSQVSQTRPDLILYEAPLFNDNLNNIIDGSIQNEESILSTLSKTGATLMVEPSAPIYNGIVYPTQETSLKQAVTEKYNYVDTWSAFPASNSVEMKNLTVNDGNFYTLNDAGNKVWSDYLKQLFISK